AAQLRAQLPVGLPLWSSPLQRARVLAEALHPAPQFDPRLAEMDFGTWEGQAWDAIGPRALDAWAADIAGFRPPQGESGYEVQARALAWLAERSEAELVVVTHAGIKRALLAHWLALPPARWLELRFAFGAVSSVRVDGDRVEMLRCGV
ncbi:MAG TPA: histidine phosphatase family protein, partial [Rhodocyclaceae bacterium]|nr:histidine phosphatase family protein [Rhodocyclaceae bacterium]